MTCLLLSLYPTVWPNVNKIVYRRAVSIPRRENVTNKLLNSVLCRFTCGPSSFTRRMLWYRATVHQHANEHDHLPTFRCVCARVRVCARLIYLYPFNVKSTYFAIFASDMFIRCKPANVKWFRWYGWDSLSL